MADKTPEELQKEIESLRAEAAREKERLEVDLKKAIDKRQAAKQELEDLRKEIDSSKLTEEQKKILAQYDEEKKAMLAEQEKLQTEITKLTETIEANRKQERERLLTTVSDEKLKKAFEKIPDNDVLREMIDALPVTHAKKVDNNTAAIDFSNGDVDLKKLTQAQRIEFATAYPEKYKKALIESRKR